MNPVFELDQIHRYIDHLSQDPKQLGATVESHFFPVLQRIFFREGFEVCQKAEVDGRTFPFLLKDLDLRRPSVAVDFAYQKEGEQSVLPGYAIDWRASESRPRLLILRNQPLLPASLRAIAGRGADIRFLDFVGLKGYATNAFQTSERRERSRAVTLVIDMIEQLIRAVAVDELDLTDIAWFDLERLFHRTLTGLGFKAHLTPTAGDGGRDVLACDIRIDDVHWYAIEIKHWTTRKPGTREVEAFLDTSLREGRSGGLFLSTSGVSSKAIELRTEVHSDYLRFSDGERLAQSCRHYVAAKEGVWSEHKTLRSFLFDGTR